MQVFLAPRRIHISRPASGWRRCASLELSVPCSPPRFETDWQGVVATLARTLAAAGWKKSTVDVTLSNHFVRYALVPTLPGLKRAEREAAAMQHFAAVYGEAASEWKTAVAENRSDRKSLAAAVEPALVTSVKETLVAAGLRPGSISPFLVSGYNALRNRMSADRAWLAVAEPGRACVAQLERGRWITLRNQRLASPLRDALPSMLEQVRLAEPDAQAGPVYLVSREELSFAFPAGSPWSLQT